MYDLPENNIHKPWSPPLFRWAGSKRKLLPILTSYVPKKINRYIEPFAGSACLFFALKPQKAVLGDINEELLFTYQVLKNHPRILSRATLGFAVSEEQYYTLRKLNPESLNSIDRAARFIYLNRYCFNGVYRTNKKGEFNVPRGVNTGNIQDEACFYRFSVALRNADLRANDFTDCLEDVQEGDFIYLDPPYAVAGKPRAGEYGNNCFDESDINRLVECLIKIDEAGAKSFHQAFRDSFPDIIVTVEDMIAEGDKVAARCSVRATHTGNSLGYAATNKQIEITGMVLARIENGKIIESWNNFDFLKLRQQIDAI